MVSLVIFFEYSTTVTFDACAQYCCTSEGPYRTSSFFQKLKVEVKA